MICASVAVLLMSMFGRNTPYVHMIWPLLLLGFGGGLFHPPNNTAVLAGVPPEELGVANGFFTTSRNFGQAIGASLAAEILAQGLGSPEAFRVLVASIGTAAADAFFGAYLRGQSHALEVAAALGLAGAVISALRGKRHA
jgi:sugar phosphate permease